METKKKSKFGFIFGSLCAAACAVIVVPKVISALSTYMYSKQTIDAETDVDEDWGPVIDKKQDDHKEN